MSKVKLRVVVTAYPETGTLVYHDVLASAGQQRTNRISRALEKVHKVGLLYGVGAQTLNDLQCRSPLDLVKGYSDSEIKVRVDEDAMCIGKEQDRRAQETWLVNYFTSYLRTRGNGYDHLQEHRMFVLRYVLTKTGFTIEHPELLRYLSAFCYWLRSRDTRVATALADRIRVALDG